MRGLLVVVLLGAVAIDQAAKVVVLAIAPERVVRNVRGSLAGLGMRAAVAAWVVALAVAVVITDDRLVATGLGLSLGGAAGNLVDRVRRGAVVDFLSIGRWPPFNVADAALVAGLCVIAGTAL
jgi:signal peptidase II